MAQKLMSQRHPVLYFLAIWYYRIRRYWLWYFEGRKYAQKQSSEKLIYRVKKHQSPLIRHLGNSDLQLQYNKVVNLKIAYRKIDGMIIRPGETFSFCKLVGLPTKRKGYLLGLELSNGEARTGIGGGLCQLANLIHWLVLHSPLTLIERHHHSFDPFPDHNRILPFGSGVAIFYNYIDLRFTNHTPYTFQLRLGFSESYLQGELRSDTWLDYSYHVYELNHRFLKIDGEYFRSNEIWRKKVTKSNIAEVLAQELIAKNFAKVMYTPDEYEESMVN